MHKHSTGNTSGPCTVTDFGKGATSWHNAIYVTATIAKNSTKLPDALRPVAAEWHTVPEERCEMCRAEKVADLWALLETVINGIEDEWMPWFREPTLQDYEREWLEQARAALEEGGNELSDNHPSSLSPVC